MYVYGITECDEHHKKMYAIAKACQEADVAFPDEVAEYFDDDKPEEEGRCQALGSNYDDEKCHASVRVFGEMGSTGFMVDLSKLPPHTSHVKFELSW